MTMTKEKWKQSIEIDGDESTNILYDKYQTLDDDGKEIMQKGINVHFDISETAVAEMLDTYEMKNDILSVLSNDDLDGYADLYVTLFDRNHIDSMLVITENDEKLYIDNPNLNVPDSLKEVFVEKVEGYFDMKLEDVKKHLALDVECENEK